LIETISPLLTDPAEAERLIRREFGGTRVLIPDPNSRKDPARRLRIVELSAKLPTSIVAARVGCSESYVRRIVKR
jgi:hypothetical protein